jgi:hypothetical protein
MNQATITSENQRKLRNSKRIERKAVETDSASPIEWFEKNQHHWKNTSKKIRNRDVDLQIKPIKI